MDCHPFMPLQMYGSFHTCLNSWFAERLYHLKRVNLESNRRFPWERLRSDVLALRLVVPALGLVLDPTAGHHPGRQHVAAELLMI